MDNFNVCKGVQARTGGEIYIGVVGPAHAGKPIFIKRFIGLLMLPAMEGEDLCNLSRGEPPQSAASKAITITEPEFIPKEVARVSLADGVEAKVRVVSYAGFMVDGAADHVENGEECLVKTPWFDYDIPFTQTAEIGTRKVTNDHSTIGIVVTTDRTIGEIKRPGYVVAEEQTIDELKKLGKPLVVLLSSTKPCSDETTRLAEEMSKSRGVSVLPANRGQPRKEDIFHILERILKEFPVTETDFHIPRRPEILSSIHWLKTQVIQAARDIIRKTIHVKDVSGELKQQHTGTIRPMNVKNMQIADDRAGVQVDMDDSYYCQILSDYVGLPIEGEYRLIQIPSSLANVQKEYEKMRNALTQVRLEGYRVVTPECSEIVLDEPQAIEHGNKYSVKMKVEMPFINLIKAHIRTEIVPVVESEQRAQGLTAYIKEDARESDDGVWNINIFGKPIEQIAENGIRAKVSQMTGNYQLKLQDALQKIINDNNGGMICVII